jgi:hypothetical protein
MAELFRQKDPKGVEIFCESEQWEQHVLTGHSMMKDNMEAVISTIASPDYIHESHDSVPPGDYRIVYSKAEESATYYAKTSYTKVIASVCGGSGELITAYASRTAESGTMRDKEAIYIAERAAETEL